MSKEENIVGIMKENHTKHCYFPVLQSIEDEGDLQIEI